MPIVALGRAVEFLAPAVVGLVVALVGLVFVGLLLFIVGIGLLRIVDGTRGLYTRAHVSTTDPLEPGDAPTSGHATVVGRAIPAPDGPSAAPFSGRDALGHRYRIRQRTDGVGWWTVADGGETGRFLLEGPTGRVLVEGRGAAPDGIERQQVAAHDPDESFDVEARGRLEASAAFDPDLVPHVVGESVSDPRQYEEGRLEPGQEVYVYGVCRDDHTYDARIDADESVAFVVDDDPPADALADHGVTWRGSLGKVLQGGLAVAVGGFFLYVIVVGIGGELLAFAGF
ncbi:hypothetical protein [Halopiger goleimassiliensis]|uniref:hypothetical protein n=1 Tax=Halopiger goleimassiliensis TaxID=1293048 RepID=UPI0006782A5F|nr:hypothetical protein [Halopiger goleimassiliensis]